MTEEILESATEMTWRTSGKQNLPIEVLIPTEDINLLAGRFKNRLPNQLKGQIQNQAQNQMQSRVQDPAQSQVQGLRPSKAQNHLLRDQARDLQPPDQVPDPLLQDQEQGLLPAEVQHLVQVR